MNNIIEPNESFDFSKLSLAHPVGIQGGAYFTRIEYNNKPLYIQTSKSLTRQGIVKTGKKYYCDLMFNKNSESLINWFENLEEKCHKLIYEKKDAWFQGNLEENDIESAFNPLIRVYKSGKFYLLRTNIKNTKDDLPSVKIYNENEIQLNMNDITTETEIISILDIQGIKFTTRNFQIDIELKQVMVLDNNPIFENCLIKKNSQQVLEESAKGIVENEIKIENTLETLTDLPETLNTLPETLTDLPERPTELPEPISPTLDTLDSLEEIDGIDFLEPEKNNKENFDLDIEFENLHDEDIEENNDGLINISNVNLPINDDESHMILKKSNEVYFDLYKEARQKAKNAKKNAILAYLEAKHIKKTYMIENINDSDSDFDAEIDDVSESELEGL